MLTLALPAALLATTGQSVASPSADTAVAGTATAAASSVSLRSLPQIAQQGAKATAASKARAVFVGVVKPAKAGRRVNLQVKVSGRWKAAASATTLRNGSYELTAAARRGAPYRVVSPAYRGAAAATSPSVSIDQWLRPTYSDEFGGRTLSSKWVHRSPNYEPQSMRACAKGSPKAVKVTGGTLRLSVIRDTSRKTKCKITKNGRTGKYYYRLNGHVGTQGTYSFRYGHAAARMKLQRYRGQHSGFWMQPVTGAGIIGTPDVGGAEIDVIEYFGDQRNGGLASFVYSRTPEGELLKTGGWLTGTKKFLANKKDAWWKNYHVFSVEWTPEVYIFRIDGQEVWRTKTGISGVGQYPILSNLSSDYEIPGLGDERRLPQHTYVDWIRVWETPQP